MLLSVVFFVACLVPESVARIRLVETENPSACVMLNCKVCGDSDSAVLPVVPSCVYICQ
jgi:hypothetical protein